MKLTTLLQNAMLGMGILLSASAQTVIQDGFESGYLSSSWDLSAGVVVKNTGGALGTTNCAELAATAATTGKDFGVRLDNVAIGGAKEFQVDCYVRIQDTTNRQFNLQVSDSTGAIGNGAATLNLRYQTGTWAAYASGGWKNISGLGTVSAAQWHRLKITGKNWGQTGACVDVSLSDAGGTNFTSTATNLTWFQNGNPTNNLAHYVVFTTAFGNCPGYQVDEITVSVTGGAPPETNAIVNISGTYPHLAVFSAEGEIGIGAVAAWADRLWFVTYPPHQYQGSADKLWTVDSNMTLVARPESVGGTHANRLIHRESQQLVMGPYFISTTGVVRAVSPSVMPGRLTATARHLTDPAGKVYFASMEEGFYEVDVNTLAVTTLKPDAQAQTSGNGLILPGNHGKGAYTGQGKLFYANNGQSGWTVASDPGFNGPAGVFAENNGADLTNGWNVLARYNSTEITGPGGIQGAINDSDPIWSLGWDKRSVILRVLDAGQWHLYRLPKGSYTHDALHGWYTEWPRIREINEGRLLMHMHGLFYFFPKTFSAANTAGLQPICSYLKMPVDYCWWNGNIVMGRDDTSTTGGNTWAGQSHSAPWFGQISDMQKWGAPAGFGGVWKEDNLAAGTTSEPFFVSGFKRCVLHLKHTGSTPAGFVVEYDAAGTGTWQVFTNVNVAASGYAWMALPSSLNALWVRIKAVNDTTGASAYFHMGNPATAPAPELFAGLADASPTNACSDGILRPRSGDARFMQFAANYLDSNGALSGTGYYEIGGGLVLRKATNATAESTLRTTYSLSNASFTVDAASILYTEGTNRFRLPKNASSYDAAYASGWPRGVREVVTERRLFNAHGTFFELPHPDSGGCRKIRPVTTHNKHISDFASWRGMFVIAGLSSGAATNVHVYRSDDNQAALWFGNVDDLWRMGAPTGAGGPWKNSAVTAGVASDPYLMFGYERKVLELTHDATQPVTFTVEVDFAADNTWSEYARFTVQSGQTVKHLFPEEYSAHWLRIKADASVNATAWLTYGPAAPSIAGVSSMADGACHLVFSGSPGQPFTVLGSGSLATPLSLWTTLTNGIFGTEPAVFNDTGATNFNIRYYVIATQ